MRDSKRIAVIGLGRFGAALADELVRQGIEVMGVDSHPNTVQAMSASLTHTVVADTTDIETLRQLGLDEFDHVVVAIGDDLEASILTTSLLADLGVPDIWAKATTRQQGSILERIGAHHVVLPEHEMGERVAHLVTGPRLLDYVKLGDGFVIGKVRAPVDITGVPLVKSQIRQRHGVTVVAVRDAGRMVFADPEIVIKPGDLLIVAGTQAAVEKFAAQS